MWDVVILGDYLGVISIIEIHSVKSALQMH